MHPTSDTQPGGAGVEAATRVAIVGSGRLGTALAAALREAGLEVEGPLGRGRAPGRCDAVVLCVPDAEIPLAANAVAGAAPLVGHTSGATPLSSLAAADAAGAALFGLHPLQTFAAPSAASSERTPSPGTVADVRGGGPAALERFRGAGCAVAGSTRAALDFAAGVARRLGMVPFEIDDQGRAAYHAAASIASNFLVTLQAAAEEVAAGAGLSRSEARALLVPLLRRTVENLAALGPERALTGPIARGDDATVATQRAAVEDVAPHLLDLFDELVRHTRSLAGQEAPA
jgi:predicted short-subunit dehydrogenase-like oxidoreductase (DUF2520 family)